MGSEMCIRDSGKEWPPKTSGVAKSAREQENTRRKAFAKPGTERGKVTDLKTLNGEAPKE